MARKKINNTKLITFEKLSRFKNLINFVSTRVSGNMAYEEDAPQAYIANRRKFLQAFGVTLDRTIFCEQVHAAKVEVVDESYLNSNEVLNIVKATDALVTSTPKLCLAVKTADCVPIVFYDSVKKIIGIAHAGWKGTLEEIGISVVKTMKSEFKCDAGAITVGIGPSLGPSDFFVRRDVHSEFEKAGWSKFLKFESDDQWLLDLPGINKKQLIDEGISEDNIEISTISTYSSNKFFSYRKKGPEGHFITGAMLK